MHSSLGYGLEVPSPAICKTDVSLSIISALLQVSMENNLDMALSRRKELLEIIAAAADEMAAIDRYLPILYSQALEADLLQSEENALAQTR